MSPEEKETIDRVTKRSARWIAIKFRYVSQLEALSEAWIHALNALAACDPTKFGPGGLSGFIEVSVRHELARWAKSEHPSLRFSRGHRKTKLLAVEVSGKDLPGDALHSNAGSDSTRNDEFDDVFGNMHTDHPWSDSKIEAREWENRARASLEVLMEAFPELRDIDPSEPLDADKQAQLHQLKKRANKIRKFAAKIAA